MKHTYYRLLLLLALWSLVQLAFGQGLALRGFNPSPNARSAPQTTNVSLLFNQGLSNNAATLNGLRVFSAQRGGLLRNGQGGSASVSGSTLNFNPTTNFKPGETVYVTSTTAIQGTGGAQLSRGHVYQFTTGVGETGTGNFTPPASNPEPGVGSRPSSVAVGDVDGDGDLDLLTANFVDATVSVRLNDGRGNYTAPATNPEPGVGDAPVNVALGDLDGDGDLDFVTPNFGSRAVSVRLNDGLGNFTAPPINPNPGVGRNPQSVALGDLDGDGDLDLLCANAGDYTVTVLLNNGSGNFTNPADYDLNYKPYSVVLGDVDGDGDLDFVASVISSGRPFVILRFNDGGGNFNSSTYIFRIEVGDGSNSVALGDVDGDGDLDMLCANAGSNTVSVRLNDGGGGFFFPDANPELGVGDAPVNVALGDLDGDGDLDLLCANAGDNNVSVRLNDGMGNFTPPGANSEPEVGNAPRNVALGDVDGDGDLDFVTANQTNSTVSVRLNRPFSLTLSGLSVSPNPVCVGQPFAIAATVGNFTTGYSYTLTYGTSTTTGSSTSAAFSQRLVASGSGAQTVTLTVSFRGQVVTATIPVTVIQCFTLTGISPARNARSVSTTANVGVTFSQPLINNNTTLNGVRVFSAQRGGLLRNGQGGSVSVTGNTLSFNPTTNFKPGETVFVTSTKAIQGTGGTRLDRGQVYQFTTRAGGTGQGIFTAPTNPEFRVGASQPRSVVMGDVDGDGDLDFVTANFGNFGNNSVSIGLNDGRGNFIVPATQLEVGSAPTSVALGDLDGDGDLDLLCANSGSNTVSVRLNNGRGNFTAPATNPEPGVGDVPYSVAVGDVDGDGDLDFVSANFNNARVSVRLNDGSGNFTAPPINPDPSVEPGPVSVALGDVDGDGDLDLLCANSGSNTVSVRLNDGSGNFTAPPINPNPGVGRNPQSVALGDVDGDGDLDFVSANGNNESVSVRLNDGSGNFTAPPINPDPSVEPGPVSVALGDVDGDGDLDLLTANSSIANVSVLLNDGSGNFTPHPTNPNLRVGYVPRSVALGDMDGDGDLDLLTANSNSNTVSVLFNQPFPLTLTGFAAPLNPVCVGSPLTFTATVGNVRGSYNFTLTNGTPAGTTVSTATGSGFRQTLTAVGNGPQSFTLTVSSEGYQATATTSVTVTAANPTLISSGALSCAVTSVTLTAGGGSSYRFASERGVLGVPGPANTAVVSSAGTYSVTVTDTRGCSAVASTRVESRTVIVSITNPAVITATTEQDYAQFFSASGGDGYYSYSLNSGSLAPGLGLSVGGVLQGSPTRAGSFTSTIKATDTATGCSGISSPYVLTVTDPTLTLAGLAVSPNPVCVGQPLTISATLNGNLSTGYSYTLTQGSTVTSGTATSSAFNQSLPASGSGMQTVTLTVSSRGQVVTATIPVTVNQCLTLTGLSPARNARSASPTTSVALTFDQGLSNNAATLGGVRVFSAQRGGLLRSGQGGSASVSGSMLTFDPATDFRPGETVYVTSMSAIQSTAGGRLNRGQVYQFTTGVGGTGRGNFTAPATNPEPGVGRSPLSVALGDVDGDGDLDLVTANNIGNTVSVRLNDGRGNYTPPPHQPGAWGRALSHQRGIGGCGWGRGSGPALR